MRLYVSGLIFLAFVLASISAKAANANRICHQDWCYTGDKENSVTSSVVPTSGESSLEMGFYLSKGRIEFWEMPFKEGRYEIKANIVVNRNGQLVVEPVINSRALFRNGVVFMLTGSALAEKMKKGRFFKVRIYRNGRLDYSATYPLYGFSKAYGHLH